MMQNKSLWDIIQRLTDLSEQRFNLEQAKHTDKDSVWLCASDIKSIPEIDAVEDQMLQILHNTDYATIRKIEAIMMCGMDIYQGYGTPKKVPSLDDLADLYGIPSLSDGGSIAGASEYIISKRHLFMFLNAYMNMVGQKGQKVT